MFLLLRSSSHRCQQCSAAPGSALVAHGGAQSRGRAGGAAPRAAEEPPAPQGQRQPAAPTSGLSAHWACCHPLLPGFFSGLGCKSPWLLVEHMPVGAVLAMLAQRPVRVCLAVGALRCSWWQKLQLGVRRACCCFALLWCPFLFPGCMWVLCLRRMNRGAHRAQNNAFVRWYRFASPKNPEKCNCSKASQDALLCGSRWEYVPLARQTKSLETAFNRQVKLNILISKNRGKEC